VSVRSKQANLLQQSLMTIVRSFIVQTPGKKKPLDKPKWKRSEKPRRKNEKGREEKKGNKLDFLHSSLVGECDIAFLINERKTQYNTHTHIFMIFKGMFVEICGTKQKNT
jgi:hypothetical protein